MGNTDEMTLEELDQVTAGSPGSVDATNVQGEDELALEALDNVYAGSPGTIDKNLENTAAFRAEKIQELQDSRDLLASLTEPEETTLEVSDTKTM